MAEIKQQNKPGGEEKPEEPKDPLALDMSKKTCNKILSEKLRSTKIVTQNLPKPRRVEKGVVLETICDANDVESRISITKITNKLSNTDLSETVSVKSFNPEEVKDKYDSLSRDVEMWTAKVVCGLRRSLLGYFCKIVCVFGQNLSASATIHFG